MALWYVYTASNAPTQRSPFGSTRYQLMYRILIASLALAASLATPLAAQDPDAFFAPELDETTYGMLCFYSEATPDIPLTAAEADEIWFDETRQFEIIRGSETLLVPAIPGISFGIAASYPEGEAHVVSTRIIRTFPDGTVIDESFPVSISDEVSVDAWYLDLADGPMEATYHFRTMRDDVVIYEMTFTVVAPDTYSGALPDCVSAL